MFTRQHLNKLAATLQDARYEAEVDPSMLDGVDSVIGDLAYMLKVDNPNVDKARFMSASGMPDDVVAGTVAYQNRLDDATARARPPKLNLATFRK